MPLRKRNERRFFIIFCAIIGVAVLALKLINVFTAPLNWDTSYYLNIGSNFILRGGWTPYMSRLDPSWNIVTNGSGYGVVFLDYWLKVFGLSLNSGHIFMYLVGLLTIPIIYAMTALMYNKWTALLAALFFVADHYFFVIFYVRMDAPSIFAYSAVFMIHNYAVRRNIWWLHFFVGIGLVLTLEFHILGLIYVGALSLYYLVDYVTQCIKAHRLLFATPAIYYGIGLGIATAIYVVIHVLPNPGIYFSIKQMTSRMPFYWLIEVERYLLFFRLQPLEVMLFAVSILAALWRNSPEDRRFVLYFIGAALTFYLISAPDDPQYTGHLLPLMALGVGALLRKGFTRSEAWPWQKKALPPDYKPRFDGVRLSMAVCLIIFVSLLVLRTWETHFNDDRLLEPDYVRIASVAPYVATLPKDAVIMAKPYFFAWLLDFPRFLSYRDNDVIGRLIRHEDILTFWKREQPQILIEEDSSDPHDDPELLTYMQTQGGFSEILPKIWVANFFLAQHPYKANVATE